MKSPMHAAMMRAVKDGAPEGVKLVSFGDCYSSIDENGIRTITRTSHNGETTVETIDMNPKPPTAQDRADWLEWLNERPKAIRDVAVRFKPWKQYRIKQTGQKCSVVSFSEPLDDPDAKVTLIVNAEDALGLMNYNVFGIDPDDLELA